MTPEEAFIAEIASTPDDDAPRLIFADWLEENAGAGRRKAARAARERAELIRLQCRLDPDRDRFDDPEVNALRERVEALLWPLGEAEEQWLDSLPGRDHGIRACWRRGFVDALELPVQAFLSHGEQLRQRYPLLRKLVLFRLNGWGERLARCEWLRGIREIELPCWYADDDARAVAASPYLGAVERVVCWSDDAPEQGRALARGSAWPGLRSLHLVARRGEYADWVSAVNGAAGRPIGSVHVVGNELFPIAADFDEECFIVGKLPDGTQLFLSNGVPWPEAEGIAFDPDGTEREGRFRFTFPPHIVEVPQEKGEDWQAYRRRRLEVRNDYLRQQIGFVPTMIRVKYFDFYWSPTRFIDGVTSRWGRPDPPPGPASRSEPRGYGEWVYDWVTSGSYQLCGGNNPWCDGSGHITAT
jgi:uncharacterized protein (TIGR02996 family)